MTEVEGGAGTVKRTGTAIVDILGSVKHVAALIDEIANASEAQSLGLVQVNEAVSLMDEATQHNTLLVQNAGAAPSGLSDEAAALHGAAAFFRVSSRARAVVIADARRI